MKKLLSLIMVVLIGFLSCGVSGYEVEYFSDGGKTITYTYEELSQLSEKHKQLLEEIINDINIKRKRYTNIKIVSNVSSVLCIVAGIFVCVNKGNKLIPGIALGMLGALSLVGVTMGFNCFVDSLKSQKDAVEERINVIDATKRRVNSHIADGLAKESDVKRDFYYTLFFDEKGFIYQVERGGANIPYMVTPLKTKYRLDRIG